MLPFCSPVSWEPRGLRRQRPWTGPGCRTSLREIAADWLDRIRQSDWLVHSQLSDLDQIGVAQVEGPSAPALAVFLALVTAALCQRESSHGAHEKEPLWCIHLKQEVLGL